MFVLFHRSDIESVHHIQRASYMFNKPLREDISSVHHSNLPNTYLRHESWHPNRTKFMVQRFMNLFLSQIKHPTLFHPLLFLDLMANITNGEYKKMLIKPKPRCRGTKLIRSPKWTKPIDFEDNWTLVSLVWFSYLLILVDVPVRCVSINIFVKF